MNGTVIGKFFYNLTKSAGIYSHIDNTYRIRYSVLGTFPGTEYQPVGEHGCEPVLSTFAGTEYRPVGEHSCEPVLGTFAGTEY